MKYKLIKCYPGSPELECIATLDNPVDKSDLFRIEYKSDKIIRWINQNDVLNYPEHWQLVVEKDYEILAYYDANYKGKDNIYSKEKFSHEFHRYSDPDHKFLSIYQVKRLSDSEIFTIGDKVNNYDCDYTIKSFNLIENRLKVNIIRPHSEGSVFIDSLRSIKKPLFTTEDGVNIYETGIACGVSIKEGSESDIQSEDEWLKFEIRPNWSYYNFNPQYWKMFSTKEAAEEWIIFNKPCLSMKDIIKNWWMNCNPKTLELELRKLVESKL